MKFVYMVLVLSLASLLQWILIIMAMILGTIGISFIWMCSEIIILVDDVERYIETNNEIL